MIYARGVDLVEGRQDPRAVPPIPAQFLRPAAGSTEQGLKGEYFKGKELQGAPVVTRVDRAVNFRWDRLSPTTELVLQGQMPAEQALGNDEFSVRWTGQLVPPVTGTYELTVTGDDGFRLDVAGTRVLDEWTPTPRARARSAMLDFEAGKAYDVKLEYFENIRDAEVRLNWRQPGAKDPVRGGARGGARRRRGDLRRRPERRGRGRGDAGDLPRLRRRRPHRDRPAQDAAEAARGDLHATGKPVVLVLMTGSALAVEWAKANLPAVLVAWYPGQQGGNAIADVLFGKVNPSGRLPVTFYKSVADLPPFADYAMKNRTYRYFTGEPLYAFGYGLSYTRFDYTGMRIAPAAGAAAEAFDVSFDVQNTGTRRGPRGAAALRARPRRRRGRCRCASCAGSRAFIWRRVRGSAYPSASRSRIWRITTRRRSAS